MDTFLELTAAKLNYWVAIILVMIGLYAMIAKNNLVKKLIGMAIFQSAIILFFVSSGVKLGSTIPILEHDVTHPHVTEDHEQAPLTTDNHTPVIKQEDYTNPLPHVLMLTAIVVGVATLGVALATVQKIYQGFGTLEENEIIEQLAHERKGARSKPQISHKT